MQNIPANPQGLHKHILENVGASEWIKPSRRSILYIKINDVFVAHAMVTVAREISP